MRHLILLTLSYLFSLSTIAQPALVMQNNVTYLNMMNTRVRDKKRLVKVSNLVKNSYLYR